MKGDGGGGKGDKDGGKGDKGDGPQTPTPSPLAFLLGLGVLGYGVRRGLELFAGPDIPEEEITMHEMLHKLLKPGLVERLIIVVETEQ